MKKAQATAFIVLGIIIAALAVIGIAYKDIILAKITKQEIPKAELQRQADEVKSNIESCIIDLADDAADQMGARGGYLNLPDEQKPLNLANPFASTLVIVPGVYVPYWFYQDASGIQKLNLPDTALMEKELANYVNDNLLQCIDLESVPLDITYENPKTSASIFEKSISIKTEMPLTVRKNNTVVSINKFSATIQKPLGELYTYSKQILESEMESNFLEEKTMDMFVVYDEIPYSGVDFECSQKTWSRFNAMRNIKSIISSNIQYLKIHGTDYELVDKNHKYFELPVLKKEDPDLQANFMFSENWPMFVDVLPDDPILKSESFISSPAGKFVSQLFCLNYYNFVYSLRYPVLIALTKDDYTFQFANEVIIDHNQPKKSTVDINYLEGKNARVCEHPIEKIKLNVMGFDADGNLNQLDDAKISFKCLGVICDIGSSDKELLFPQCLNGLITAEKEGYNSAQVLASTNAEQEISINLEPIYKKDLTVLVTNEKGGDRAILSSEMVLLQFEDKDQNYFANAIYPSDTSIDLIAGNYNIKATIMSNLTTPIQLKENKIKSCSNMPKKGLLGIIGLTEKKCFETTIPAIILSQAIVGGEEFEYSLSREELAQSNKIIVYAVRNRLPESVDDIPKIIELISKNKDNIYFKTPLLK